MLALFLPFVAALAALRHPRDPASRNILWLFVVFFGAVFGLPIISQPQVAILGVGSIDKRVVVVDDMIAVRPMCYLTLGFDHRLIDGADAGRFLQALKNRLQDFDESWV